MLFYYTISRVQTELPPFSFHFFNAMALGWHIFTKPVKQCVWEPLSLATTWLQEHQNAINENSENFLSAKLLLFLPRRISQTSFL